MIIYSEHYTIVKEMIRQKRSRYGEHEAKRVHNEDFISWFANKIASIDPLKDDTISTDLRSLARGPSKLSLYTRNTL
ncbi:hypothetical protein MA16_Dca025110 [Dendrobium catenatum]|uniref:Uncharacterized protein n=1 Tax=Dendrobium catenatum TaxID=906689 RepID=A0A2I0WKY4_9ASPA|nr:hypothetical protein MA16_Dca025110 [Dendrobium catenatum]